MRAIHMKLSSKGKSSALLDEPRVIQDGIHERVLTIGRTNDREAVYKDWFDNHPEVKSKTIKNE